MKIVEEIRKFVEEECKKPTSKYGYEIYLTHFVPTSKIARLSAERLNADAEVVEIAALLHDIGSIIYGRENHHMTSAEIAGKKLKELNYPLEKIEKIKKCILTHNTSQNLKAKTIEAQILADADGMAMFERIEGLFAAALVYENLGEKESRFSVKQKLIKSFDKLSLEAREIIKPKYEAAMLLLR